MPRPLIVHGQKGCPDCETLKTWLKSRDIEFEYREDLTRDQIAPQIFIKSHYVKGKWEYLTGLDECLEWLRIKYESS